ncbi:hypothetical protein [Rufibacter hautae]|uniref:Uncharacterized protein n=1 Tax=Rufibacter hautae TaxID=2595005 RepID=A0A5B6T8Z7_9BACT|nr:hypothetical protein [Rufibacter hautae]KAA3435970.1 hypothetical protein FOA19_22745 [Rufibacter hautae]
MPLETYIIGLVLIPISLLVALLWWRFYGSGKEARKVIGKSKSGNYKSLRTYRYEVRDFVTLFDEYPEVDPESTGTLLEYLFSNEEYLDDISTAETPVVCEESRDTMHADSGNSPKAATAHTDSVTAGDKEEPSVPGVRNTITPDVFPGIEQDDSPAQSLYYNPLTAPAPTDNDKKNREAEIALKRRRRAELKNNASAAQSGFNALFSPDSSIKNAVARNTADSE